ncbi:unnamed protein product [Parnassius mnemosyne]|uniref:VWFA domain-containing protein n=1 Tax=Parnassius mnemosyne TaxID=213953 RepID=A0AAV1M3S7_9NEOP
MVKKLLLFVLIIYSGEAEVMSSVPAHLIACYRNGGPLLNAPHRIEVFLSIVRRLELSARLDMRLFSASLIRRFRLDGIQQASNPVETEFVLPFRASAFQFNKFKLLMDLFLPSQNLLDMDESLSLIESCLLHKLLSSMVQPWERGDENLTCPVSTEHRQKMINDSASRIYSRCPIENGVIQTDWGPIAPGTVVAAITASLESQRVSITDILSANIYKSKVSKPLIELAKRDWEKRVEKLTAGDNSVNFEKSKIVNNENNNEISNIWVATLAGDLAEVVVNQGPRVGASSQHLVVGSNNRWNDSVLPRTFYLLPQSSGVVDWHFTDAEILAGIDGLILASYVPSWIEQRRSLRLSQVLEMYYSNEGVSFDPTVRACNRLSLYTNAVNSSLLTSQTLRFAHILSLKQITVYIPLEEMQRMSEAAVTAFMEYVPSVLQRYHQNCLSSHNVPEIDLIVATDGSWKGYDVEQFTSWIGRALEIDQQRSTVGLLHGNTGRWIVPPSNNMTAFFSHIANFTDEWPNRLNVPNILSRINEQLRNQTLQNIISEKASAGRSTVVLVISPSDQLTSDELERSRELMYSIRSTYFDAYFVYAAQDLTNYKNINNEYMDYSEIFITLTSSSVLDVTNAIDTYLIKSDIPKKIVGAQCPINGTWYDQVPYEDAILPGRKQYYRIHPFYLRQQARIHVQFRNDAHGRILVCMWRGAETSQSCQMLTERDIYTFNLTTPCPSPDFCPPAHFAVTILSTLNSCAHADCRFPNQVGYYIRHSGFRCFPLLGAAVALSPVWKVHLGLSLMISFLYFNQ